MALDLNSIVLGSEDPEKRATSTPRSSAPNPDRSDEASGWFGFQAGLVSFFTPNLRGEFEPILRRARRQRRPAGEALHGRFTVVDHTARPCGTAP